MLTVFAFFFTSKTSEGFYMKFSTKKWLDEVMTLGEFSVNSCFMILRRILQDGSLNTPSNLVMM